MGYSRTKGAVVASDGFYVGAKNTETLVITSAGVVQKGTRVAVPTVTFTTVSAEQVAFVVAPVTGYVAAAYIMNQTADRSAAFVISAGSSSASSAMATATTPTGTSAVTVVTTMTPTTVAVTAGQLFSVTRGVQATTGASTVNITLLQTSV